MNILLNDDLMEYDKNKKVNSVSQKLKKKIFSRVHDMLQLQSYLCEETQTSDLYKY